MNHLVMPPFPPPAILAETRWRRLTTEGNAAFADERWSEAARLYRAAIVEAEILFRLAERDVDLPAPAPVMLNIAYHNAAELEARGGHIEEAGYLHRQAFERLADAAEAPGTPARLRQDCVANLKQALIALGAHLLMQQHVAPRAVEPLIERARRIVLPRGAASVPDG